ncbi:putative DMT superfamily transporter inner membrane protein [Grimontia celer]|uniref:Putative DMT superfamily transporter inner membrane protein n=1 Tax=Grimontia celer TaxID=1796497 RepID=A0A128F3X7_9GAMM|nr:DMT family transporter [Grimontia celer]CZF80981.1 putative DMT superfamily transporter inner membrane protein [Grimontia celer]
MNASLYVITVLIWGTTWLAIAFQIGDTPVVVSVGWRFAIASAALLAWLAIRGKLPRLTIENHKMAVLLALCLFSNNFLCFYFATQYIPSGLNAVVFSLAPILNALNLWWLEKKRPDASFIQGALMGFSGVLMLFGAQFIHSAMDITILLGLGVTFVGTYFFSMGNLVSARAQQKGMPLLPTTGWAMGYGALYLFAIVLLMGHSLAFTTTPLYVSALVYLAIIGSVVGFNTYLALVGRIGAAKAAYCTVLFPLVALSLSTIFEDYEWTWQSVLGVMLVVGGNLRVFGLPEPVKRWYHAHR